MDGDFPAAVRNVFATSSGLVIQRELQKIREACPAFGADGKIRGPHEIAVACGRQALAIELLEAAKEAEPA